MPKIETYHHGRCAEGRCGDCPVTVTFNDGREVRCTHKCHPKEGQ